MTKKRFELDDNFDDVNAYIESPKETPAPVAPQPAPAAEPKPEAEKPQSEVPHEKFRRNVTLSEEALWRLNYIKDRKNKNRAKGDKFITLESLIFDMVQHCLDTQYASTKKKFDEYKQDDEDWV